MKPLVSVVMPTCKGKNTVLMSANSVLKQNYPNIELIIIDDNGAGSKEQVATQEVLSELIDSGEIIYIEHKKNSGGAVARNTGIKASHGKYICFLDDDDLWLENKITCQVEVFESLDCNYGLVACTGYAVKENGIGYKIAYPKEPNKDLLFELLSGKIDFNSSTLMVKAEVAKELNGFDESFVRHQDWEFICRLLDKYKGYFIEKRLVIKYVIARHVLKDTTKLEIARHWYLDHMKGIISKFSSRQQKEIYAFQYRDLSLMCLMSRDLKKFIKYLCKAGNPIIQFSKMVKYALGLKFRHRAKYAPDLRQR